MSTTKGQRIGIIIIAIVMAVGTIGSFFVVIVANKNAQQDQELATADQDKQQQELEKQMKEYQDKQDKLAAKLSPKYYSKFEKYKSSPAPFDASKVTKLETKDLKDGDGKKVENPEDYSAYYIGWNASGETFDSSFNDSDKSLKAPIDPSIGLIEGWSEGVKGMKVGGIREISIPADQAYGEQAQKGTPTHGPLKFIVMAIPHESAE